MNILMLGRWLPVPRHREDAGRALRFARHLAHSHRVTLAFVTDDPNPASDIATLREEFADLEFATVARGWRVLSSAVRLVAGDSCTLAYHHSEALRIRLSDRVRTSHFDLAFVTSSSMIRYALALDTRLPILMDFGAMESLQWEHQAATQNLAAIPFFRTEAMRLRAVEAEIAKRAARCLVGTPEAARVLGGFAPQSHGVLLPDGIDTTQFQVLPDRPGDPTVAVVGTLRTPIEIETGVRYFSAIAPAVRAQVPGAQFLVVAPHAPPSVRKIDGIAGLSFVPPGAGPRPVLHRAAVALAAPTRPDDSFSEIFQAMAVGLPVVATRESARALGVRPGYELCVADDAGSAADQVVGLLRDPVLRAQVGGQGAAYVHAERSWATVLARLGVLVHSISSPKKQGLPVGRSVGGRDVA